MPSRYSQEFKNRALRMVDDALRADPGLAETRAMRDIAPKLGLAPETLQRWYVARSVDQGDRPGVTSSEHAEIKLLRREVADIDWVYWWNHHRPHQGLEYTTPAEMVKWYNQKRARELTAT